MLCLLLAPLLLTRHSLTHTLTHTLTHHSHPPTHTHTHLSTKSICLNDVYRRKLTLRLQAHHPNKVFIPVDGCHGGSNVSELSTRVYRDLLRIPNVDAIMLLWDSDASDLWRYANPKPKAGPQKGFDPSVPLLPPPTQEMQDTYTANLVVVLTRLKQKTPNVIVGGPVLFGERPRGLNPLDPSYEAYLGINRRVCAQLNVTYIDFRSKFFSLLPPGWEPPPNYHISQGGTGGKLTLDGEHLKNVAREVIMGEFLSQLYQWWPGDDDVAPEDAVSEESRARLRRRRENATLPKDYFSPTLFLPNNY